MVYEIVNLDDYSGSQATLYSIIPEGETETLFDKFVDENLDKYREEIEEILETLYQIGNKRGARVSYFKTNEGNYGDNVCALFDEPERNLRIYCIRYGMDVVILGNGGFKSKEIKSWQEDEHLTKVATEVIEYAKDITYRITKTHELGWSADKTKLVGKFKFTDDGEVK